MTQILELEDQGINRAILIVFRKCRTLSRALEILKTHTNSTASNDNYNGYDENYTIEE